MIKVVFATLIFLCSCAGLKDNYDKARINRKLRKIDKILERNPGIGIKTDLYKTDTVIIKEDTGSIFVRIDTVESVEKQIDSVFLGSDCNDSVRVKIKRIIKKDYRSYNFEDGKIKGLFSVTKEGVRFDYVIKERKIERKIQVKKIEVEAKEKFPYWVLIPCVLFVISLYANLRNRK